MFLYTLKEESKQHPLGGLLFFCLEVTYRRVAPFPHLWVANAGGAGSLPICFYE